MSETPGWSTPGGSATPAAIPAYGGSTTATVPHGATTTPRAFRDEGPALVPMRPMGTGELLDTPFAALRRYPKVVLTVSAVVVSTASLIQLVALLVTEDFGSPGFGEGFTWFLVDLIIGSVAAMLLAGVFAVVYGEAAVGRPVALRAVWAKVRRRRFALVAVALLAGLAPWLGLVLLVLPGVFLWGALALSAPVLMLEDQPVWASLRRSWRLSTGDWWRIWALRILAGFIAGIVAAVLTLPFTGFTQLTTSEQRGLTLLELCLGTLGEIVGGTIAVSLSAGVLALLYIDRRMRCEGLDIALAAASPDHRDGAAR